MNRSDLQKLSDVRAHEARNLLQSGHSSGAYYLTGYAVECALKACIARLSQKHDFPDRDRVNKSYSHKLSDLMAVAGLDTHLNRDMQSNPKLAANWAFARNWSEQSRYRLWSRAEAESMVDAIMKRRDGVIPWIRRHW
jgi:HEPN domain-containing protein